MKYYDLASDTTITLTKVSDETLELIYTRLQAEDREEDIGTLVAHIVECRNDFRSPRITNQKLFDKVAHLLTILSLDEILELKAYELDTIIKSDIDTFESTCERIVGHGTKRGYTYFEEDEE